MPDPTSKQRRYGYRRGEEWAIEPRFEKAEPFHHGLAAVRVAGQWGYIGPDGRMVIEPRFDAVPPAFLDGNFAGVSGIDRTGRTVFNRRLQGSEGLFPFNEGGIQAWDGRWGFRDRDTGEIVIEAQFGKVHPFWGDYAAAMQWTDGVGGRWGLIDRTGAWALEPTYTVCNGVDARGGLFSRKDNDVWLVGAVHPTEGITAAFEERHLVPDRSRLDPVWPPSKPRTAEDEALVVDSEMLVLPVEPPRHPFRFYGRGILDGRELQYRVHFAASADMEAAVHALDAMSLLESTPWSLVVQREGQFAYVALDRDEPDLDVADLEQWFVDHFVRVHAEFPIEEVVLLAFAECDSPWQAWSIETQWPPDEGPKFGLPWLWE
ncbi:MAG: WG repeat-containing protein [Myxococcota bacterium]